MFVVGGDFLLSLGQRHVVRLLGGGNGIVESSGPGAGGAECADEKGLFIFGQLAGVFRQGHGFTAIAQVRIGRRGQQPTITSGFVSDLRQKPGGFLLD